MYPKYGIGPLLMGITKRNNNHSFTEYSRKPVENLIKGFVRLYYNALTRNRTDGLNSQSVRACLGNSSRL